MSKHKGIFMLIYGLWGIQQNISFVRVVGCRQGVEWYVRSGDVMELEAREQPCAKTVRYVG